MELIKEVVHEGFFCPYHEKELKLRIEDELIASCVDMNQEAWERHKEHVYFSLSKISFFKDRLIYVCPCCTYAHR